MARSNDGRTPELAGRALVDHLAEQIQTRFAGAFDIVNLYDRGASKEADVIRRFEARGAILRRDLQTRIPGSFYCRKPAHQVIRLRFLTKFIDLNIDSGAIASDVFRGPAVYRKASQCFQRV